MKKGWYFYLYTGGKRRLLGPYIWEETAEREAAGFVFAATRSIPGKIFKVR